MSAPQKSDNMLLLVFRSISNLPVIASLVYLVYHPTSGSVKTYVKHLRKAGDKRVLAKGLIGLTKIPNHLRRSSVDEAG